MMRIWLYMYIAVVMMQFAPAVCRATSETRSQSELLTDILSASRAYFQQIQSVEYDSWQVTLRSSKLAPGETTTETYHMALAGDRFHVTVDPGLSGRKQKKETSFDGKTYAAVSLLTNQISYKSTPFTLPGMVPYTPAKSPWESLYGFAFNARNVRSFGTLLRASTWEPADHIGKTPGLVAREVVYRNSPCIEMSFSDNLGSRYTYVFSRALGLFPVSFRYVWPPNYKRGPRTVELMHYTHKATSKSQVLIPTVIHEVSYSQSGDVEHEIMYYVDAATLRLNDPEIVKRCRIDPDRPGFTAFEEVGGKIQRVTTGTSSAVAASRGQ